MSNFLSQFEDGNYKKRDVVTADPQPEGAESVVSAAPGEPADPELSTSAPAKAAAPATAPRRHTGIQGVEHEVVIDTSYSKVRIVRYIIVSFTVIALVVLFFFGYRYFNSLQMLGFDGKNLNEARTWGLKNRIELDIQYAFNTQSSVDIVISQDIPAGTTVQKGTILGLVVSKGANPDEKLTLPDFGTMTTTQVREWIKTSKATNVNVIQEYSDTVAANQFIKKEFSDVSVDAGNFTRKDYMVIHMSRGRQPVQTNINLPDFGGYTKAQVSTWLTSNPVTVKYVEEGSDTVAAGLVISQDVAAGTQVSASAAVTLKISIGKGETVPDYSKTNAMDAPSYAPGLTVAVKTQYSDSVPYGSLISQSVQAGQVMYGDTKKLNVVYSEGRPFIDQLAGRMEKELPAYFFAFVAKGANITYSVSYVDSAIVKGTVVWSSKFNEYVGVATNVTIRISKGNLTAPTA
jgi:beta-lactam-binding protein with PASTA domain